MTLNEKAKLILIGLGLLTLAIIVLRKFLDERSHRQSRWPKILRTLYYLIRVPER